VRIVSVWLLNRLRSLITFIFIPNLMVGIGFSTDGEKMPVKRFVISTKDSTTVRLRLTEIFYFLSHLLPFFVFVI